MVITKRPYHRRRPTRTRPRLEGLESRCLLSAPGTLSPDALFHETLDAALDLKSLGLGARLTASGTIGAGPEGAADVNWYKFSLSATAEVRLAVQPGGGGPRFDAAISLYNEAPPAFDPYTFAPTDPYTPDGHRLLAQDDIGVGKGPRASAGIDRLLGPGTYWVAVSGSGNDYFQPFLAGSGLNGSTGGYRLSLTATDPGAAYDTATPVVLASDPAPGAVLGQSPFVLRFDLNSPIDPATVQGYYDDPTSVGQLLFNTVNDFGPTGGATPVTDQYLSAPTALVYMEPKANELQIDLAAPLVAGFYQITLTGRGPGGGDYVAEFQVAGPAGDANVPDQPGTWTGTAREIPFADDGRLHQAAGAVGVDPSDPSGFLQAGVEMYHFSITHPGTYALDAEVFAGRIGSPLDASLSLFKMEQGSPVYVASDGDTDNAVTGTDGRPWLFTDPALFETLGPGDYYLAVSSGSNFPNPSDPFDTGAFDPSSPQSGSVGGSGGMTGPYVLNLLVQPVVPAAPHVVSVAPDTGPTGDGALTAIRVRFDRPVNLLDLAFQRYQQTPPGQMLNGALESAALTAGGQSIDLRLGDYDGATNTATFILLGAVPPGQYTLTLSGDGPEGIVGEGGVPLAGNQAGTDTYTTSFAVTGEPWHGNDWESLPGFNTPRHAQPIGALFPDQLSQGVTITHDATAGAGVTESDYGVDLMQSRVYSLSVEGDVPDGTTVTWLGADGGVAATCTYGGGQPLLPIFLNAGHYTLRLTWPAGVTNYVLHLSYSGSPENPTPLVVGSGPAVRLRLLTGAPDGATPPAAPATADAGASPAASSGGPLPGTFTLPSSALLAQGFSPLEGIAAAGGSGYTGGDRVLVRAPADASPANALLGLVIVTTAPLTTPPDVDPSPAPTAPATPEGSSGQGSAAPVPMMQVLDLMFEMWQWLGASSPSAPGATAPLPPAEGGAAEARLVAPPARDSHEPPAEAGRDLSWVYACALAVGALAAPVVRTRRAGQPVLRSP